MDTDLGGQVLGEKDGVIRCPGNGTLQCVDELPDISGPVVLKEHVEEFRRNPLLRDPVVCTQLGYVILG